MGVVPSTVTFDPGSVLPDRFARNGHTGFVNGVSRLSVGPVSSRVTVPTTGSPTSPQSLIATTCTPQRAVGTPLGALMSPSDSVVYAPSLPDSFPGGTGMRVILVTASLDVDATNASRMPGMVVDGASSSLSGCTVTNIRVPVKPGIVVMLLRPVVVSMVVFGTGKSR